MEATSRDQGWRKSSRSGPTGEQCIEVKELGAGRGIRDSKSPDAPHLTVSVQAFRSLIEAARSTELDA